MGFRGAVAIVDRQKQTNTGNVLGNTRTLSFNSGDILNFSTPWPGIGPWG
ncbi:MAG: hypothetical protein WD768_06590 [Phycisphaeraceae bacterium]